MGPRSKPRLEFVSCTECKCWYSSKDREIHVASCQILTSGDVGRAAHGFVQAGRLTASPKYGDAPKYLAKPFHNDVVLLHPTAMQLLEVGLGGPVVAVGGSDSCPRVLTAWPNPSAELTSVGFINCVTPGLQPAATNEKVTISPLSKPYVNALEVRVKTRESKPIFQSAEFLDYIHRWADGRFLTRGNKLQLAYFGQPCQIEVTDIKGDQEPNQTAQDEVDNSALNTKDSGLGLLTEEFAQVSLESQCSFFRVVDSTCFSLDAQPSSRGSGAGVSLDQVGGLKNQINKLRELIDLHFKQRRHSQQGLSLPKGILLYGPSGTGKTMLAHALIHHANVHTVDIQGTEIWNKNYGESENRLAARFQEAAERAPSIIFIDEIDAICPKRQRSQNELEKRVVSSLITLMDRTLSGDKPVVILSATNKRDEVDTCLRRPGRLEREVEVGVPNATDRAEILTRLLSPTAHTLTPADVKDVADQAHGFVGADLAAVCKEAGILALNRHQSTSELRVNLSDVMTSLQAVQPSAMREVALEISKVSWTDIGGQHELKAKLRQAVEWPLQHPESFTRLGIRPPRGLLMYGPPGCSKTMIAKALSRESGLNFIAIKGPELFSKWVGESERAVREVFRKARAAAPAIVFFDEIDSIAGERGSHGGSGGGEVGDRVLAQLLTEIDGVVALKDVTVVAATNRPERIDKALLRPGRLDRIVYVPLPDPATRREIFTIRFRETPVGDDVSIEWLVARTERYSGAEVSAVCHEAALSAMQEDVDISHVSRRHFESALVTVTPRISPSVIASYDNYARNSGLHSL